jgi:hypothetical protein
MATTIITKNGSGAPLAGDLTAGELAVDLTNKRLYSKDSGGTVIELGTTPSGISGGTIDDTVIGGTTPAAGTFTSLTATGDLTVDTNTLYVDSTNNRVNIGNAGTVTPYSQGDNFVIDAGGTDDGMSIIASNSSNIFFGDAAESRAGRILYLHSDDSMRFYTNGNSNKMTITSGGNVGIGESSPGAKLSIAGGTANDYTDGITLKKSSGNIYGIYPSTNNLEFRSVTGGNHIATFDYSGGVSIGATTRGTYGPNTLLVSGANNAAGYGGNLAVYTNDAVAADKGGYISLGGVYSGSTQYEFAGIKGQKENATSGVAGGRLVFNTTNGSNASVERMRIDSSGNLLVNETAINSGLSSVAQAQITGSTAGGLIINTDTAASGNYCRLMFSVANATGNEGLIRYNTSDYHMSFWTDATEAMRLDSSGNLLVGKTSTGDLSTDAFEIRGDGTVWASITGTSQNTYHYYNTTASQYRFYVKNNGGIVNFSANNVNLSDQRTKKAIVDAGGYLSKLCQIPVRNFRYNHEEDDGKYHLGVISQEVEAIAPEFVQKDAYALDDETTRDAIYTTDLNFAMLKAIQEQQAMIETLQAQVAELQGAN